MALASSGVACLPSPAYSMATVCAVPVAVSASDVPHSQLPRTLVASVFTGCVSLAVPADGCVAPACLPSPFLGRMYLAPDSMGSVRLVAMKPLTFISLMSRIPADGSTFSTTATCP